MKFVIHHHITEKSHYDLMVEDGNLLDTWRIDEKDLVKLLSGIIIDVVMLQPHRKDYLDYEGPVSCGRGRVELYDSGSCQINSKDREHESIALNGNRFMGILEISKTPGQNHKIFFSKSTE